MHSTHDSRTTSASLAPARMGRGLFRVQLAPQGATHWAMASSSRKEWHEVVCSMCENAFRAPPAFVSIPRPGLLQVADNPALSANCPVLPISCSSLSSLQSPTEGHDPMSLRLLEGTRSYRTKIPGRTADRLELMLSCNDHNSSSFLYSTSAENRTADHCGTTGRCALLMSSLYPDQHRGQNALCFLSRCGGHWWITLGMSGHPADPEPRDLRVS